MSSSGGGETMSKWIFGVAVVLLALAARSGYSAESGAGAVQPSRPDKAVEEIIKTNFPKIQACINTYADKDATPKGKLVISWNVGPGGAASNVAVETEQFKGTLVGKCYTNVIEGLKFPAPAKGAAQVKFPFFYSGKIAAADPSGRGDDTAYSLEESQVLSVIKARSQDVSACLKRQAEKDPSITGKMIVSWEILPSGGTSKVALETDKFRGSIAAECIVKVVEGLEFPRFRGEPIPVKFPFNVK
jgi:hypothetical protein